MCPIEYGHESTLYSENNSRTLVSISYDYTLPNHAGLFESWPDLTLHHLFPPISTLYGWRHLQFL